MTRELLWNDSPLVLELILGSKLVAFKLSPLIALFPLLQMCRVGINENLFLDIFWVAFGSLYFSHAPLTLRRFCFQK